MGVFWYNVQGMAGLAAPQAQGTTIQHAISVYHETLYYSLRI
jgi:hypothetical protein